MALDSGNKIVNTNTGIVADGKDIAGGYFAIDSLANIPTYANVLGALCFVTAGTDAGKFFKYNGTTWEEAEFGGGIEDVKVNGTSVVTDKVANIPVAGTGALGAVKVDPSCGIEVNADNNLKIIGATNSAIESLNDGYHPIVPSNLKKAVMEGLGKTVVTWTDTYKENARNTIGAEAADATILKQVNIVDNTTSTLTTAPLSARQGKVLNDRITNLEAIGRFLSLWNCATGLPTTNPETLPYTYKTGDYYRINTVDSTTNYMPNGSTYDGTASTTAYGGTETVARGDLWFYDGTSWGLLKDKVGGFVEDVQVNGTSIVSSGVANIVLEEYTAAEIDTLWNNI